MRPFFSDLRVIVWRVNCAVFVASPEPSRGEVFCRPDAFKDVSVPPLMANGDLGRSAGTRNWPSSNTSTAPAIRAGNAQPRAGAPLAVERKVARMRNRSGIKA